MAKKENAQVIVVLEAGDGSTGYGVTTRFEASIPFKLCEKAKKIYDEYYDDAYDILIEDKEFESFVDKSDYCENLYELLQANMVGEEEVTYYEDGDEVDDSEGSEGGFYHWWESLSVQCINTEGWFNCE